MLIGITTLIFGVLLISLQSGSIKLLDDCQDSISSSSTSEHSQTRSLLVKEQHVEGWWTRMKTLYRKPSQNQKSNDPNEHTALLSE